MPPAAAPIDADDQTFLDGIWHKVEGRQDTVACHLNRKDTIPVCPAVFSKGTFFKVKNVRFASGPPEVQEFDYMDPRRAFSMKKEPGDWLCPTREKHSSPEHKTEKKMWKRAQRINKPKDEEKPTMIEQEAHSTRIANEIAIDAENTDNVSWPLLWTDTSAIFFGPRACRHYADLIHDEGQNNDEATMWFSQCIQWTLDRQQASHLMIKNKYCDYLKVYRDFDLNQQIDEDIDIKPEHLVMWGNVPTELLHLRTHALNVPADNDDEEKATTREGSNNGAAAGLVVSQGSNSEESASSSHVDVPATTTTNSIDELGPTTTVSVGEFDDSKCYDADHICEYSNHNECEHIHRISNDNNASKTQQLQDPHRVGHGAVNLDS